MTWEGKQNGKEISAREARSQEHRKGSNKHMEICFHLAQSCSFRFSIPVQLFSAWRNYRVAQRQSGQSPETDQAWSWEAAYRTLTMLGPKAKERSLILIKAHRSMRQIR